MICLCGRTAISLRKPLGVSHLKQIIYSRPRSQNIIIFQIYKYFLGIQQTCDTEQELIIDAINQLLSQITQNPAQQ